MFRISLIYFEDLMKHETLVSIYVLSLKIATETQLQEIKLDDAVVVGRHLFFS